MNLVHWSLLSLMLGSSLLRAQTGTIVGVVANESGIPIPNANVSYRRLLSYQPGSGTLPQLADGEAPFDASSITDSNGNHSSAGLPPGNYQVCVTVAGLPYLDPCKWSSAPIVSVAVAATATLNITPKLGVFLKLRINDPLSLLPTSEKSLLDLPHLITGVVFGTGGFLASARVSSDAQGQNYQMPVPAGVPCNLWLHSRFVALTNAQGISLSSQGTQIPFTAQTGQDESFTVNVTGLLTSPVSTTSGVKR